MSLETRTQKDLQPILQRIRRTWPISVHRDRPQPIQFSLVKMLVVLTVSAVLLGLFTREMRLGLTPNDALNARVASAIANGDIQLLAETAVHTSLTAVDLSYCDVHDKHLRHFASNSNLKKLSLDGTQITDVGMSHIASLPKLKVLSLKDCQITDNGVMYLNGHQSLAKLDLRNTLVTDAAMRHLARMRRLREVRIASLGVTKAGIRVLLKNERIRLLEWNDKTYQGSALEQLRSGAK